MSKENFFNKIVLIFIFFPFSHNINKTAYKKREREKERERQTDRQTERKRERDENACLQRCRRVENVTRKKKTHGA